MARFHEGLPGDPEQLYLAYVGLETDLIFNHGVDLPGFASFPLLQSTDGLARLEAMFRAQLALGDETGCGVILESPTWMANADRAAPLGYDTEALDAINKQAIQFLSGLRQNQASFPIIISGNIGPRGDAYAPEAQMSQDEATAYHGTQISQFADTDADIVSAYTLTYPAEAIGIVRAAQSADLPAVISFTVETDGHLPTGTSLHDAIAEVDAATDGYAMHFMVNCAHPDHIAPALVHGDWTKRLKGIVANASRCSHAELDEAETLDDGNPTELGQQLADIRRRFPHIQVLGGCCGTDMRHMAEIARHT